MQGGKLISANYSPSYLFSPFLLKPPTFSPQNLEISQLVERFDVVEEFVPSSFPKFNVDALEFTPTGEVLPPSNPASVNPDPAEFQKPDKYIYDIDSIFSVFKDFCQIEEFRRLDNKLSHFAHRKNQVFRVFRRGSHKAKREKKDPIRSEEFKPTELEYWRKAKSLEEEKIRKQAINNTIKLTSTKDDKEQAKRKIKITLNKLSPSNLSKLQPELLSLAKDSRDALAYLIQTIFEKSWAEVKYTAMYAQLCQKLKYQFEGFLYDGESPSKKNKNWFRFCLLNHVQNAFEDTQDSPSKDAEQKALLHKKKTHGSVRFIAELHKVKIISDKIVQDIVEALISLKDKNPGIVNEEKLEIACVLISTLGVHNESKKLKSETDKIFFYLSEVLSANSTISSKVKFSIMNLIDERTAGWVRDVSEQPKKVEEIKEEFDRNKFG